MFNWLHNRNNISCCNSEKGFSMIEVLVAMVILGVGVMSIVTLQVKNYTYNNSSRRQTDGYTWAMDQIEWLLTIPYTSSLNGDLQIKGDPEIIGDGNEIARGPYTVEWDVSANPDIENSRIVNVSVLWNQNEVANVRFNRVLTRI